MLMLTLSYENRPNFVIGVANVMVALLGRIVEKLLGSRLADKREEKMK